MAEDISIVPEADWNHSFSQRVILRVHVPLTVKEVTTSECNVQWRFWKQIKPNIDVLFIRLMRIRSLRRRRRSARRAIPMCALVNYIYPAVVVGAADSVAHLNDLLFVRNGWCWCRWESSMSNPRRERVLSFLFETSPSPRPGTLLSTICIVKLRSFKDQGNVCRLINQLFVHWLGLVRGYTWTAKWDVQYMFTLGLLIYK